MDFHPNVETIGVQQIIAIFSPHLLVLASGSGHPNRE
jgi:hypothetical protein